MEVNLTNYKNLRLDIVSSLRNNRQQVSIC